MNRWADYGKQGGIVRKETATDKQAQAQEMYARGKSMAAICIELGISRSTLYRYLRAKGRQA